MTIEHELTLTPEALRLWNQEQAILAVTELICEIMEAEGISRKHLAEALGKSKGYLSQLLDGSRNMTIRTISDAFSVMGYEFVPTCAPIKSAYEFTFEFCPEPMDEPEITSAQIEITAAAA